MKYLLSLFTLALLSATAFAQDTDSTMTQGYSATPKKKKINLDGRANDHLLLQFGYHGWSGETSGINTGGVPRTANIYFLFDFPFKSSPQFSAAIGAGIGTDHMFFDKTYLDIKGTSSTLNIIDQSDTSHFKKFKLATTWVEAPIELRYSSDPLHNGKSFKAALGVKVGLLLAAHTKGKTLQNASDATLNAYTVKEFSKRYFNTNRVALTARVGYGVFSVFGSYSATPLFKEGVGPVIRPYSIGLTISGL